MVDIKGFLQNDSFFFSLSKLRRYHIFVMLGLLSTLNFDLECVCRGGSRREGGRDRGERERREERGREGRGERGEERRGKRERECRTFSFVILPVYA